MTPQERIEEAHGLWELAIARVSAMTEIMCRLPHHDAIKDLLKDALAVERRTFEHWRSVSTKELTP